MVKCYQLMFIFLYIEIISAHLQSKNYLPLKSDLKNYVRVLQNITNFYLENTEKITISIAFGIFAGNVHLGRAMKDSRIDSAPFQTDLMDVYVKSEEMLKYYQWHTSGRENGKECLKLSPLFSNTSEWIDRLEEFKSPGDKYMISPEFSRVYHDWKLYARVANVRQAYKWTPTPEESDNCLKSLAAAYTHTIDNQTYCLIDDHCYQILKNGSDIGYALCHRALLMVMARNSRACRIFSPHEDRQLFEDFCSMGYTEAEYIAYHKYGLVDLLLEHKIGYITESEAAVKIWAVIAKTPVSVCVLNGRTEFLRRIWLNNILKFQTKYGCFSQTIPGTLKQLRDSNNDILDGRCNGHTTVLASSVLAAAIRYTLKEYY